jgi:hypothetical protein
MKINPIITILYILLAFWAMVEIFISVWMFKAKPDKGILIKYPKKIVFLSQLPFGKSWIKNIDKDDIKLFTTYQERIRVWYLSIIIPIFLIPLAGIIYIYMAIDR